MRKRSPRKPMVKSAPVLCMQDRMTDILLHERLCLNALMQGWGNNDHFNLLLDSLHMVILAAEAKKDRGMLDICEAAKVAMANVRIRRETTGKLGGTSDELAAIGIFLDASEDFWKRTSGYVYNDAFQALLKIKKQSDPDKTYSNRVMIVAYKRNKAKRGDRRTSRAPRTVYRKRAKKMERSCATLN